MYNGTYKSLPDTTGLFPPKQDQLFVLKRFSCFLGPSLGLLRDGLGWFLIERHFGESTLKHHGCTASTHKLHRRLPHFSLMGRDFEHTKRGGRILGHRLGREWSL